MNSKENWLFRQTAVIGSPYYLRKHFPQTAINGILCALGIILFAEIINLVAGVIYLFTEAIFLIAETINLSAERIFLTAEAINLNAKIIYLNEGAINLIEVAIILFYGLFISLLS